MGDEHVETSADDLFTLWFLSLFQLGLHRGGGTVTSIVRKAPNPRSNELKRRYEDTFLEHLISCVYVGRLSFHRVPLMFLHAAPYHGLTCFLGLFSAAISK